jgi:anti-sigma28 factor (negative regulator of flagellin synthesis)
MVTRKTSRVKRLRDGGERMLLDEKRLSAIRRRIADGYYDRKDVGRRIVERLASQLLDESEETEP